MRNFYLVTKGAFTRKKLVKTGIVIPVLLFAFLFNANNSFAQIALRGTATTATSTSTTLTINKPTGVVAGDVMIVNIVQSDNDNNNLANASRTGWIIVDGREIFSSGFDSWWGTVLYRVADGTEGANFAFTLDNDANDANIGSIIAYSGVNVTGGVTATGAAGGPFDVDPGNISLAGSANTTVTAPGLTTVTANAAVIMLAHLADDRSISGWNTTSPGALAELYDNPFNSTLDLNAGSGWAIKPTTGATGNGTATLSGTSRWGGLLMALKPCTPPTITGTLTVCVGSTTQLTGAGTPAASNPWVSATPSVATVSNTGLVTGVAAGTSVITYTNSNGCTNTATVTVNARPTVGGPTSVCIGNNITMTPTTGGTWVSSNNGIATITNAGVVTGVAAGTVTFTFTQTSTGCSNTTASVTVLGNSTITLTSAAGTTNQTICVNTAITNITYAIGGTGTGANVSGLPAGVNGSYSAGVFTISGTATAAGTHNYTVTTTGPCGNASLGGTITVTGNGTIALSSAAGTNIQAICLANPITDITYNIGGTSTGASITAGALPPGVNGSFSAGVFTISGTASASGVYNYTVGASGSSCINPTATGTITVNEDATISLSSAAGTDAQVLCALAPLTDITYSIGGFGTTGANVTGLPAGVNGSYSVGVFTISGAPTATGTFSYTVTTTGPCTNASLNGTVDVNTNGTVTLSSAAGTDAQSVCVNNAIADITYAIGGDATSASITAGSLPAGVTGSFSAGVFTITGTPTVTGTYTYTVEAAGSACANLTANGSIMVNEDATISLSSAAGTDAQTLCINTAITGITYAIGGAGVTGATVSGLPAGVTGGYSAGVYTISGTATASGIFNYTVTTTGPCATPSLGGTITVQANSTITLTSGTANQTICINTALATIAYTIGGDATNASLSAGSFPAGVTGSFSAGVFTISGTPTAAGVFPYSITTSGPCINPTVSGTITVNDDATIVLSSAAGTNNQTLCINTTIINITYAIGGGGTGATVSGLPAGVTGSYSGGVYTISGTATASGTFNYTVTTTGPCVKPAATGTIVVQANSTLTRTSAAATTTQTVCINTAITNITYSIGGGGTGASLSAGSFPAGVTGSFSAGVYTISGTPTVAGVFNYTITTSGPCVNPSLSGTITINDDATITLTSAGATTNQTLCINTALTAITYSIGGGGTGATVSGLPAGVTGSYNSGTHVYTISGSPTAAGTFNYTVTTTGPCIKPNATGTIIVQANSTITRTSAAGTDNQTKCINTALTPITYSVGGGGTNISLTAGSLPAGVTGTFSAGVFTISGTATAAGTFNYTVTATGPCANASLSGTIIVNDDATITLTSVGSTTNQTVCINTAVTAITYLIGGGGTGATITGLPAGVTGSYNAGTHVYTISGSPTASGTFNYTVTTTGPCIKPNATGTIIVTPNAGLTRTSAAATTNQTVCINNAITNITYSVTGSGTGATVTGLPAGVNGNFSAGVFTISGTPTAPGVFNYTVTTTGPCANPSLGGTITVNNDATIALTSAAATTSQTVCINTAITNITYLIGGGGTGATITGLPAGVSGSYNSGTHIYTISGSPTASGTFNYTVTSSGPCIKPALGGTITVTPNATIALTSGAGSNIQTVCRNAAIANITYSIGGSGTGATVSGLPAGLTGNYSAGVFTISGAPTAVGTFGYTVTTTGPCSNPSATGTITVNAIPTGTLTATESSVTANDNIICAGSNVTFTATSGYGSYIFKVNGTTTQSGISNVYNTSTLTNGQSVTVDAANGFNCGATFGPIVITVNALPTPTLSADRTSICPGDAVTFTAGGGTSYTFKVNGSPVQSGASNIYTTTTLTNGQSVTVTTTNASGCSATSSAIVITVNALPTGTLNASATSICTGDNVTFTATAGYTNYNFKVNGISVQNGSSNTYSSTTLTNPSAVAVDVTNAAGCQATFGPVVITVNLLPSGTLSATENSGTPDDNSICSGSSVTFTATAGFGNYDFKVNGISQQSSASNTFTTSTLANNDAVTVTATNGSNCSATFNTITITVIPSPAGTLTATPNPICTGDNVTLTATAGFDNYDFKVNGSTVQNGSANTYSSTTFANGDVVTVEVSSANACITTFNSVTITVNALPSGTLVPVENSGNTADDGIICTGTSVVFTAPAGFTNYNFLLNAISIQNGPSNTYTNATLANGDMVAVAITNASGCIALLNTVTVSVNSYPVVQPITGTTTICVNETTALSNTTPAGVWSTSNATHATVDAAGIVTGIGTGTAVISYTVTNAAGCSTTENILVTVNGLPFVSPISGTTDVCIGNTTQLTSSTTGGTWSSDNTAIATVDNTGLVTGIADGTAIITYSVTNANGCTRIRTVTVTVNPLPVLNPITGDLSICLGNTSLLANDTDGGVWSSDNTSVATVNSSTGLVTSVAAGTANISYTVTDGNGCSATETAVVTILALPVPTLTGPNPICPNSTGIYTTEPGQSNYTWSFTGGTLIAGGTSTDNTITITWDQPGPKTITVNYTNADGCFGAASATVTTSTGIVPFLSGSNDVCLNSSEVYTTDPGQSNYTWSVTSGTITSGGTTTDNTATITWITPGTGSVSINYDDVNGCTVISPTVLPVTIHPLPNATINGTTSVCQNAASPNITFTGSAGTAPYTFTYNINGGGDLTVTTVSGNSVTVAVPTSTTGVFIYNLTAVSDNNNCSRVKAVSATVTVNELPTATIDGTATVCQNNTSPVITFTGTTGTAPFTFSYNINGLGTQTITTISGNTVTIAAPTSVTGTFIYNLLSVQDDNGCSQAQTGSATITVSQSPTATISGTVSVCQNGTSPVITFTGADGTAPYIFTYNINGAGSLTVASVGNTATVIVPTTTAGVFNYNLLSVEDVTLCSQSQTGTATVTVNPTTVGGTVGASTIVCSGTNSGTLNLTGNTGNVTGWEFSTDAGATWTPIVNTTTSQAYTNLTQTTIYHAIVQSGVCSPATSGNATITVNPVSVGGTVTSNATVCSGANSGTLTLSGHTGTIVRWEFSINGGGLWTPIVNTTTTQNYTNLTQTTLYRAVVANGVCSSVNSAAATITVNALPTATISGTVTVCQNAASPVITFTGANGTAPYTFTYKINAGGNLTVVSVGSTATVNAPTAVIGTFAYTLVSVQSSGIPACSQTQTGSATITVTGPPAAFTITPASASICQGSVQPLSAGGGSSSTGSLTFSSGNINQAIPDEGNRASTVAVAGIPAGAVINSVSVNFSITHTYDGDLRLNLTAPNGNTLNLVNRRGGSGDNFVNTVISSTSVNPVNAGTAPFTNTYSADATNNTGTPNSNVTAFSSLYSAANGNWTFNANDVIGCHGFEIFGICIGSFETGTLNSWSITFNYTIPSSPQNVVWSPITGLYTDAGATTAYASQSLSTVYAKPNTTTTYTATATNAAGCNRTQTVVVAVNPTPVVTITADYCAVPGKVRLTATSVPAATSYIWSNGATTSFIDVDVAGSFDVTVFAGGTCPGTASINVAQELVVNGDFESGNVGFITPPLGPNQYIYQADIAGNNELVPEGLYGIGPDAHTYHNGFWGHDHTTGSGNFMIINGFPNGNPQPIVWQETVNVLPSTTYYFAAWGMSVNAAGPFAQLQFNVNGAQVGTVATLPAGVNNNGNNGWTRFYGTWTSGPTTTSAIISITDLQNAAGGNDFGLDDISFATLSTFITLESAPGTDAQTVCVNTPITNIIYSVGNGNPTGPNVTGLPAGVTSSFLGNILTITGTPTVPGNYTYNITTTGGCLPTSASGTITVQSQAITLSSGSSTTTTCTNSAVNIGYTLSGTATGATTTGLPAGVTGSVAGTTYTISGTPTVAGTYPYTITTSGTCTAATINGTIIVQAQTITLNSGNNNQTVCINTAIANIQYTVAGTGTGVNITGLPAGVTYSYTAGLVFINGTPTVSGTFTYTATTTGTCTPATATGTITVTAAANLVLTSAAGTNNQNVCRNVAISNITYMVNGATGATVTGLPAGVTGSYSAGTYTISGIPTVNGTFNYTVTTSGGCGTGTATGTIIVQSQTITLTSGSASPTLCANTTMTNIVYTFGGSATTATVTGLPAGVSFAIAGNILTISGTPTANGSYPYTVTTSGMCAAATANGTITVQPGAVGGTVASVTICSGGSGTLTVTGQSGTIVRWEYSVDGGTTWIPITNTTITQTYNNILDPTKYRAVITNGCGNAFSTTADIAIHNYWSGVTNTDWHTATNWSDNLVPTSFCADVHIKGGKPNQPTLGSGVAQVENIHIYTGAILTVDNATLKVSGIIDNTGTFIASNGSLEMNGTVAQTIPAGALQTNALKNLIVSNSSIQGVTIGGPLDVYRSLTYTGTGRKLNTGGFLTLKSTATETAWIGDLTGNVITGEATVERYIGTGAIAGHHAKSWQLLATPTTGQTIKQAWQEGAVTNNGNPNPGFGTMLTSNVPNAATQPNPGFDVFTAPGPSIKTYNSATNTYVGPASTGDPIYNQKGYFILVRGDRSVITSSGPAIPTVLRTKGTLFTPSNPAPVTNVTAGTFESVGNPYASAIDVRNITRTGGVDEFFYVWDPRLNGTNGLGGYQTIFKVGTNYFAMPGAGSYGSGVNNFIQSGQAFLVQATGTNGTVSFTEGAKASGSTLLLRDNQSNIVSQKMLKTNLYIVNASGNTLADGTLNIFGDNYSNDVDGLDAKKPGNTAENVSVKTNDRLLAIERKHTIVDTDTIHLNLTGTRVQNYSFEFTAEDLDHDNLEGFVEDSYLQTSTALNLSGTTVVNFNIANIPGSYAADRFRIVFKKLAIVPVTFTSVKAYRKSATDKKVNVEWTVNNELNIKHYEVEKSANGIQFTTFTVTNPLANNGGTARYIVVDDRPVDGYNYYRIRSVDLDGKTLYTTVVRVFIEVAKPDITIYPNPITNGIVNLQLINQPAGDYGIRLYNNGGQVLMSKQVNHAEGTSTEKINWNYNLAHGTYYLEVVLPGGNKKVIKVLY